MAKSSVQAERTEFRYVPGLDGVRGVAILLVVLFHSANAVPPGRLSSFFGHFTRGLLGVDVFFVLSGTLITVLIMREVDRGGRFDAPRFYARRALRLLPGVYLLVAAAAVLVAVKPHAPGTQGFGWDALGTLFYYSNWLAMVVPFFNFHLLAHTWSLAIEEQFYFLWPVILVLGIRRLRPRAAYAVVTAGAVACFATLMWGEHRGWSEPRLYCGLDTRGGSLLVGCVLGLAISYGHLPRSARARTITRRVAAAGLLVAAGGFAYPGFLEHRSLSTLLIATCLITAPVILVIMVEPDSAISRALSVSPMVWLGRVSYSLYLWHPAVFAVIRAKDHPDWSVTRIYATQIGLSMALTLITYYGVERFARRWRQRLQPRTAATPSHAT